MTFLSRLLAPVGQDVSVATTKFLFGNLCASGAVSVVVHILLALLAVLYTETVVHVAAQIVVVDYMVGRPTCLSRLYDLAMRQSVLRVSMLYL